MLNEEAQLIALVSNEILEESNAIICLEGDGNLRTEMALELFKNNLAPFIFVSGGLKSDSFSISAPEMADYLFKKGVPKDKIMIESKSQNTYEQAKNVIKIAKEKGWEKIILVASAFHQSRAFLTFLKVAQDLELNIKIFNAPAKHNWFEKIGELNRLELLSEEFKKIKEYQKKGYLVSIREALEYQKWKEKQK